MKVTIPGHSTLTGRPETILRLLEATQTQWENVTGDDYIKKIQETAARAFDIRLEVDGDTYAERAESLLQELAKNGMIIINGKEEN